MNPIEFKAFCKESRKDFFKKFPAPKTKERNFWRNANRHANNALEDGYYNPEFFCGSAKKIIELLKA